MSAVMNVVIAVGALAVVLGVLVFVHEAGHFMAAKWAGIYVHRFSLGMGSPIRALTRRRGETEYSISWLPLGGYVKMASQEEEATSAALEGGTPDVAVPPDRVFESKPLWKRMIVILAGVTMNVLFAFIVYSGLALWKGEQIVTETRVGLVAATLPAGAEALRLLRPGDRIVSVAGRSVASWDEIVDGIRTAARDTIRIGLDDGRSVLLSIHSDAMKERLTASVAMLPFSAPIITAVVPGRPGERAGLQVGDTILSINGQAPGQWWDVPALIEPHIDEPVTIALARGNKRLTITARPAAGEVADSNQTTRKVGQLGVLGGAMESRSRPYSVTGAIAEGARRTLSASTEVIRTARGLATGRVAGRELGGPILIGQLAGQTARLGGEVFLNFMALISVNLAVLNLLPVPVLDGGQFMFLLAEAIRGRPLPLKLREQLTMVGLVLIVLLMVFAFWNDIRRLIEGLHG